MTPRLVSCYFSPRPGALNDPWTRMATVLAHSATAHSPGLEVAIERIATPATLRGRSDAISANTGKLDYWTRAVHGAPDGAQLILMDADTFVLRDITAAFNRSFDLAYTVRDAVPPAPLPFNAGVIFVRVGPQTRRFMSAWSAENHLMATDKDYHLTWFRKYGGVNQAALGKLLEDRLAGRYDELERLQLHTLPCSEWNCEDYTWDRFSETTRVVHVKSALRRDVFHLSPAEPRLRHITRVWRELEREAARAEGRRA